MGVSSRQWFELAAQVYPAYTTSLSGVVAFAIAVTLICTSWAVSSGRGAVALTAREAKLAIRRMDRGLSERVFVTHALGLVQGWAWVDVVDGGIKALLATPPLVALGVLLPPGVSDLIVTLAITALVTLGLLHGIWLFARQMARVNWRVAKSKSRTKAGILSMINTLGRGAPPALGEKAGEKPAPGEKTPAAEDTAAAEDMVAAEGAYSASSSAPAEDPTQACAGSTRPHVEAKVPLLSKKYGDLQDAPAMHLGGGGQRHARGSAELLYNKWGLL